MSGVQQDRPRWKRAVSTVSGVLGEAIGKIYVEKYFPESSKKRMLDLVHNLQTALSQRIDEATWMSAATKAQAKDKLENFIIKIGYPDKWKDYSGLQVDDSLSLYENMANISEFFTKDAIARKVNKPVDRDEWFMTPQTVNAYYNPTTNEICFPAGILQYPFFDPKADAAFNYGAIGVVIGHEMTHGFDDQGRQYDKDGNLKDWWTAEDAEGFNKRADMYADFFSNIKVLPDLNANGRFTLGCLLCNLLIVGKLAASHYVLIIALRWVDAELAEISPLVRITNLYIELVEFVVGSFLCSIAHPGLSIDTLTEADLKILHECLHHLLRAFWEIALTVDATERLA